jgi:UDP-N-acetylglucosamine 2-epimerase
MDKKDALEAIGLDPHLEYFIMLQHSDSYRPEVGYDQTISVLSALKEQDAHAIIIYPCSDPGYDDVIRALDTCKDHTKFYFYKSIEALVFLGLLNGCKALVGNSSGGIIEAPYLNVPFVNVGLRQEGREAAANVIWCDGSKESIIKAIEESQTSGILEAMKKDQNHFGDGKACQRIFQVLRDVKMTPELYRKRITY